MLDVIREEELQANALKVGGEMMAGIRELVSQYPQIGDVRGAGLFVGVDFVKDRETREPYAAMGLRVVTGCARSARSSAPPVSTATC